MEHREILTVRDSSPCLICHPVPTRTVSVKNRRGDPLVLRSKQGQIQDACCPCLQLPVFHTLAIQIHPIGSPERVEPDIEPRIIIRLFVHLVAPGEPRLSQQGNGNPPILGFESDLRNKLVPCLFDIRREWLGLGSFWLLDISFSIFLPLKPYDALIGGTRERF